MRKLLMVAITMTALGVPMAALAGGAGNANGCSLQGAFLAFDSSGLPFWTSVYVPLTASSGISEVTFVGFDQTLGGAFPSAAKDTGLKGSWHRTGGNTFAVTLLSIAADAAGVTQYTAKLVGTYTLLENCTKLYIQLSMGIYLPGMNPLTDAPAATVPLDPEYAYAVN